MTKIIFLNAPPRAGKDTGARAIIAELRAAARADGKEPSASYSDIVGLAHELKELTHRAYGMDVPHDFFEKIKGERLPAFQGRTPREAYIHFSETVMKPNFGQDIFGRLFLGRLARLKALGDDRVIVVPDSGFASEAAPIIEEFGVQNVLLLKIDASRRNCTFDGDSRSYIDLPVKTVWVANERAGTIGRAVFQHNIAQAATEWLVSNSGESGTSAAMAEAREIPGVKSVSMAQAAE